MWISKRKKSETASGGAIVGPTTVAGEQAGAYLDGERRCLPVFGPGGYHWRPGLGQEVLVLKGEGEPTCVAGVRCKGEDLAPGEIRLEAGQAKLCLRLDGTIELSGQVKVNGVDLEDLMSGGE